MQIQQKYVYNENKDFNTVSEAFLISLANSEHYTSPYDYWLLDNTLPLSVLNDIVNMPFEKPTNMEFNGKRESNNSKRVYFSVENQAKFPVCKKLADAFNSDILKRTIEKVTGADLSQAILRIEYCQDTDGFWLEPHTDILVKKFTMLIYLSNDADLFDAGTDIYEGPPNFKLVASAPYELNKGLIFIPGNNTWHGFSKRPIKRLRKSIIINYVSPEWRATDELSY